MEEKKQLQIVLRRKPPTVYKAEGNEKRKALMSKIESIIGNNCYNGNIQNWGPYGEWEGEGREFRYPITFMNSNNVKEKRYITDPKMRMEHILTGHYAFGANHLYIHRAIAKVIEVLESEYGLKIEENSSE